MALYSGSYNSPRRRTPPRPQGSMLAPMPAGQSRSISDSILRGPLTPQNAAPRRSSMMLAGMTPASYGTPTQPGGYYMGGPAPYRPYSNQTHASIADFVDRDRMQNRAAGSGPYDQPGAMGRFSALASPPAQRQAPGPLPTGTTFSGGSYVFNTDDGRSILMSPGSRVGSDDQGRFAIAQPSGLDPDIARRRELAAQAGARGGSYIGSDLRPEAMSRYRDNIAPTGLPGYPRAVAESLTGDQRQSILAQGPNLRRQHFGLPAVPGMAESGTGMNGIRTPPSMLTPPAEGEAPPTVTQQVVDWFRTNPQATIDQALAAGFTREDIEAAQAELQTPGVFESLLQSPLGAGILQGMFGGVGGIGFGPLSPSAQTGRQQRQRDAQRIGGILGTPPQQPQEIPQPTALPGPMLATPTPRRNPWSLLFPRNPLMRR